MNTTSWELLQARAKFERAQAKLAAAEKKEAGINRLHSALDRLSTKYISYIEAGYITIKKSFPYNLSTPAGEVSFPLLSKHAITEYQFLPLYFYINTKNGENFTIETSDQIQHEGFEYRKDYDYPHHLNPGEKTFPNLEKLLAFIEERLEYFTQPSFLEQAREEGFLLMGRELQASLNLATD